MDTLPKILKHCPCRPRIVDVAGKRGQWSKYPALESLMIDEPMFIDNHNGLLTGEEIVRPAIRNWPKVPGNAGFPCPGLSLVWVNKYKERWNPEARAFG